MSRPSVTFYPSATALAPAASGPQTLDLAGDRRPRCVVELPAQTAPGVWRGACACGLEFALAAFGDAGDLQRITVACWPAQAPAPTPFREQPGLFRR